jgi:hypothetical protein
MQIVARGDHIGADGPDPTSSLRCCALKLVLLLRIKIRTFWRLEE